MAEPDRSLWRGPTEPGLETGPDDPYRWFLDKAAERLPGATPQIAKDLTNIVLPQSSAELAATYAMGKVTPDLVPKLWQRLVGKATAGAAAGTVMAGATGADPIEEGVGGALGAGTEAVGERVGKKIASSPIVRTILSHEEQRAKAEALAALGIDRGTAKAIQDEAVAWARTVLGGAEPAEAETGPAEPTKGEPKAAGVESRAPGKGRPMTLAEKIAASEAADHREAKPGDTPPPAGWGPDPYAALVQRIEQHIPNGTPWLARKAAELVIPQTSPELAAAIILTAMGGPLGIAGKGMVPVLERMALRGGAAGLGSAGVAKVTGHDPTMSGLAGAVGGLAAEGGAQVARSLIQRSVVNRMADSTVVRLANEFRRLVGFDALGAGEAKPDEVMRRVMTGAPAKELGAKLEQAIAPYANQTIATSAKLAQQIKALPVEARSKILDATEKGVIKVGAIWSAMPEMRDEIVSTMFTPKDAKAYAATLERSKALDVLTRWMTGGEKVEDVAARLFDEKGRITLPGWAELRGRFAAMQDEIVGTLGKSDAAFLSRALYRDLAEGFANVMPGASPKVSAGVSTILKPKFSVSGGRLPWAPGWEAQARDWQVAVPPLTRAIVSPLPLKVAPGVRVQPEAETEEAR